MQIITPFTVDNTALEASNVTEDDYGVWNSGTTYNLGDRVIVIGTTHAVYESVQGSNTNHNPVTDTTGTWWLRVSATNRWKAFDKVIEDQVENATSITYTIRNPSLVSGVAFFNVEAATVQLQVEDDQNYITLGGFAGVGGTYSTGVADSPAIGQTCASLQEDSANSTHRMGVGGRTVVGGQSYLLSVYVKRASGTRNLRIYFDDTGGTHWSNFFLGSVSLGSNSGVDSRGIEDVGDGWLRCWILFTAEASTSSGIIRLYMLSSESDTYTGDGSSTLRFYGVALAQDTVADANHIVFDQTSTAVASTQVDDWYTYFYGEFDQASELLYLDQPSIQDLPGHVGYRILIEIANPGGTAKVGQIAMGRLFSLGMTKFGSEIGAQDFSVKSQDDFGNTILVQRSFSREIDFEFQFPTDGAQRVAKLMNTHRATPLVWIAGAGTSQLATTIYGWWDDYKLVLEASESSGRILVKGLV